MRDVRENTVQFCVKGLELHKSLIHFSICDSFEV